MSDRKKKPRVRRRQKVERYPATGDARDAAHVQRAEAGCRCPQCWAHRLLALRDEQTEARRKRAEVEPMVRGSVRVGANASPEVHDALTGGAEQ